MIMITYVITITITVFVLNCTGITHVIIYDNHHICHHIIIKMYCPGIIQAKKWPDCSAIETESSLTPLLFDLTFVIIFLIEADRCWLMLIGADWWWLMLIYTEWCCLVLIDADWCWLMPTYADWSWLMPLDGYGCWLMLMTIDNAWCWLMLIYASKITCCCAVAV